MKTTVLVMLTLYTVHCIGNDKKIPTAVAIPSVELGRGFDVRGEPSGTKPIWAKATLKARSDNASDFNSGTTFAYSSRELAKNTGLDVNLSARYLNFSFSGGYQEVSNDLQSGTTLHLLLRSEILFSPQYIDESATMHVDAANLISKIRSNAATEEEFARNYGDYYINAIQKGLRIIVDFKFESTDVSRNYRSMLDFNAKYSALAGGVSLSANATKSIDELIRTSNVSYEIKTEGLVLTDDVKKSLANLYGLEIKSIMDYNKLYAGISSFLASMVNGINYNDSKILYHYYNDIKHIMPNSYSVPELNTLTLGGIADAYGINRARFAAVNQLLLSKYVQRLSQADRDSLVNIANELQREETNIVSDFNECVRSEKCSTYYQLLYFYPEDPILTKYEKFRNKLFMFNPVVDVELRHVPDNPNANNIIEYTNTITELKGEMVYIEVCFITENAEPNVEYTFHVVSNIDSKLDQFPVEKRTTTSCSYKYAYPHQVSDTGEIHLLFELHNSSDVQIKYRDVKLEVVF